MSWLQEWSWWTRRDHCWSCWFRWWHICDQTTNQKSSTFYNSDLPFSGMFRGLPESPPRVPKLGANTPVEQICQELIRKLLDEYVKIAKSQRTHWPKSRTLDISQWRALWHRPPWVCREELRLSTFPSQLQWQPCLHNFDLDLWENRLAWPCYWM